MAESTATSDDGVSTTSTTGGVDSTSGDSSSSGGEASTSGSSTGSASTPCELGCTHFADCEQGPYEDCLLECQEYFAEIEGFAECELAASELWTCFGQARCDTLERTCAAELEAEFIACEKGLGCSQSVIGAIDGSNCNVEQVCGGEAREIDCLDGTCTCIDAGMVTGSCPQRGICSELADAGPGQFEQVVDEFVLACCGWDPPVPPGEG